MSGNLFELALVQLKPADWELFETLASHFLAVEFPSLRTMASPSGDGGRDSELFSPDGNPTVCLQYSVSTDWPTKIRKTHLRLKQTFPDAKLLVYATNQSIGAKADELKRHLLGEGRFLDIRDRQWFLERQNTHEARKAAADRLIERIAMPYVKEYETRKSASSPLQNDAARTALTYISLQFHDDQHGKGLTKVCFDALTRAALRGSSKPNPINRGSVHANVLKALPTADATVVKPLIDASLARLQKRVLTHDAASDTFYLRSDESARIQRRIADTAVLDAKFKSYLGLLCIEYLSEAGKVDPKDVADLESRIPRIIETLCLSAGERFVTAVNSGQTDAIQSDHLTTAVLNDLAAHPYRSAAVARYPHLIHHVVRAVATSSDTAVRSCLRNVSRSYTLFAFLNQTPDVQRASKRIFSHGKIWLDTSVVLPLFAEQLLEHDHSRIYQTIYEACRREGDELFVVEGVLNEINHHMQNALQCAGAMSLWHGKVPYLYERYLKAGRNPAEFGEWIEYFRGRVEPVAEIEIYLKEEHGISVRGLSEAAALVDDDVADAVKRFWSKSHDSRRLYPVPERLKANDVEMYLGVMGLGLKNSTPELGARAWLLTKDAVAWTISRTLKIDFPDLGIRSPLLSVSFLVNAVAFSPSRESLGQEFEIRLPTIFDVELEDADSFDLLEIAEVVRKTNSNLPERVIQRKVREAIAEARRKTWKDEGKDV